MTDQPGVNIPPFQLGEVSGTFIKPCLDCGTTVQVKDAREQPHEHRVFHRDDSPLAYAWWEGYDAARAPVLEKLQFARTHMLHEIAAERDRQDSKWGEQNHPDGTGPLTTPVAEIVRGEANRVVNFHYARGLSNQATQATNDAAEKGEVTWRDILLEEVFEALAESEPAKLRTELVQVAAVAAQWAEAIYRREVARLEGDSK